MVHPSTGLGLELLTTAPALVLFTGAGGALRGTGIGLGSAAPRAGQPPSSQPRRGAAKPSRAGLEASSTAHPPAPLHPAGNFKGRDATKGGVHPGATGNKHAAVALEAVSRRGAEGWGSAELLPASGLSLPRSMRLRAPHPQPLADDVSRGPQLPRHLPGPGAAPGPAVPQPGESCGCTAWRWCSMCCVRPPASPRPERPHTPSASGVQVVWRFFQQAPTAPPEQCSVAAATAEAGRAAPLALAVAITTVAANLLVLLR